MTVIHKAMAAEPGGHDRIIRFRKSEVIFCQGDPVDGWFEVMSGVVRTCRFQNNGCRQLTGFFYEGDVFGIERGSHESAAEAVTDIVLRRLLEATERPRRPSQALERALDSAHQCIFLLGHRTAAEKVAAFLLNASARIAGTGSLILPMSRADIADHLGLTMHTVSRTISGFVRMGLIRLQGPQCCHLVDRDGLAEIAGGDEAPGWGRTPTPLHPLKISAAIGADQ